jgi:hypothetical protein
VWQDQKKNVGNTDKYSLKPLCKVRPAWVNFYSGQDSRRSCVDISCAEFHVNRKKRVESRRNNVIYRPLINVWFFTAPVFAKLTAAQRYRKETVCTQFNQNWPKNTERTGRNEFTTLIKYDNHVTGFQETHA